MKRHRDLSPTELFSELKNGRLQWAGNSKLKIYGKLRCASGRRMKRENRVFFKTRSEAEGQGYRPCKNCMRA